MHNMHSNNFIKEKREYKAEMNEAISKLSIEARIKLKYNEWEVEITCTEDKVKQVVENVLSGIDIASLSNTKVSNEIEVLRNETKSFKIYILKQITI